MSKRSRSPRRPFRVPVLNAHVTLNRATGQGYVLLPDPTRGGAKTRRYVGRLLRRGVDPQEATIADVDPTALERAARVVAEHRTTGGAIAAPTGSEELTVAMLIDGFIREHESLASRAEITHFEQAFGPLRDLYGRTPAAQFGPRALKAVRHQFVEGGRLARWTINSYVHRIRQAFSWGVENELIRADVLVGLRAVKSLTPRQGKALGLREARRVLSAPGKHVAAVLPLLSAQVRAIVELMSETGARCGEIVQLRPCDVDRSREPWIYSPQEHKTKHHGHEMKIRFGKRARAVLSPWLLRADDSPCFSPAEAERDRMASLGRTFEPRKRNLGDVYKTSVVRRAIERACNKAGVPVWTPHQLRHGAATRFDRLVGLGTTGVLLGQKNRSITAGYVDPDEAAADAAVERWG